MKKNLSLVVFFLFLFLVSPAAGVQEKGSEAQPVAIKEVSPFTYCCIPHKGPFTEIEQVINQLMAVMQSQNILPTGPMLGIYYNDPEKVKPEELEWEIGFPVTSRGSVQSPLEIKQWPFTLVASAFHIGPYEKTGESYAKIFQWLDVNNYDQTGPVLEKYLVAPLSGTKPEDLKAEIWVPCQKKQE